MILDPSQLAGLPARIAPWLELPLYEKSFKQTAPSTAEPNPSRSPARSLLDSDLFWSRFQALPIITKKDIRKDFPAQFLPKGVTLESLQNDGLIELEKTSGTSEDSTPLILPAGWWSRQEYVALCQNSWVASQIAPDSKRVSIVSPVCSGDICYSGVPGYSDRIVGSSLFVNVSRHPFAWTQAAMERMAREIMEWRPVFLDVDPVYATVLALFCERYQIPTPPIKFIISTYEFLSQAHKRILERVFHAPVLNLYGSTETGHLLMETPDGNMAPSHKTAFLEVVNLDQNQIGDLLVTTLDNDYMPLIRYGIGDLVQVSQNGHNQRVKLHGRSRDSLTGIHGARITIAQLDRCLSSQAGMAHYQVRQYDPTHYECLFIATPDTADLTQIAQNITGQLEDLFGNESQVATRSVDYLPCESSGKFRLAVSMAYNIV